MSPKVAFLFAATTVLGVTCVSHASLVASDNSTNYTLFSNFNGQNHGTGFGAFNILNSNPGAGNGGDFVNTAANSGFDIYENGAQGAGGTVLDTVTAVRPFTGALASGQALSFLDNLNNGSDSTNSGPGGTAGPGSSLGFSLENSAGAPLFTLAAHGGGGYTLTDATQTNANAAGLGYNYHSQDTFSFVMVDALTGAYSLTVSGGAVSGGSKTFTGTVATNTGGITQLAVFNTNGGGGSDVQFDNLAITNVPEPMGLTLMGLAPSTLCRRRRRQSA